ncbi:hypothetical protein ACFVKB_45770 [Rhodococcus sp. NPDC127530]|uniref:hypothetical protein n=1 Tax=unclassified Rhodococcus (in: high G+C Gram-positive bacteria) TaxID=192944 RepID=UPI00363AE07A
MGSYRWLAVFTVGDERLSLELPADSAPEDVEAQAVTQLRSLNIRTWSDLSLQTILTTNEPLM